MCVWRSLWRGSQKVTQMFQLILDLLQGITPLPGSARGRFIFFSICTKNECMKKQTTRVPGGVRLATKYVWNVEGKRSVSGWPHLSWPVKGVGVGGRDF